MDELRFGGFLDFLSLCGAGCEVASAPRLHLRGPAGPIPFLLIPLGNATNPLNASDGRAPALARTGRTVGRGCRPPGCRQPSPAPACDPQGQVKGAGVTALCRRVTAA